ncbi:MAG: ATP-binding protein [Chloroflexota bacterium]
MPPTALLTRLEQRLPLLVGGARDLPARRQTLRAAIDWSYDLLDTDEQRLFASLGVFAGGCTLDAVETILGAESSLDLLGSLVDKSLVRRTENGGEPRVVMLETLHEYASERLRDEGTLAEMCRRHAEYYLAFAEAVQPDFSGPGQRTWLERLDREYENLRAVLRWSGESGAKEIGLRIVGVLWRLWYVYGRFTEGRLWLDQLLREPGDVPLPVLADAVRGAAALALQQMDLGAAAMWCDRSLDLFRRLGNVRGVADALNGRGNVARDQGDYAHATALHEESLALYRDLDDRQGIAAVLNNLGATARYLGDLDRAAVLSGESLVLRRQMGDSRGMAWALNNLGGVAHTQGDAAKTSTCFVEALALSHAVGDRLQSARSLEGLAALAGIQGQADLGARLFGAASTLRLAIGSGLAAADRALYDEDVGRVRATLGADAFASAWTAGTALGIDQAVAIAAGVS